MKKQQSFTKRDVYQEVTEQVISALEQGHIIWKQGWNNLGLPKNIAAGNHYRDWNLFYLNFIAMYKGFKTPYFITYKQAQDLGGNIRRGEKGYKIVIGLWLTIETKLLLLKMQKQEKKKKGILNTVCLNFMSFQVLTKLKG